MKSARVVESVCRKFPSKKEVLLLFSACVIPIHIWSIINILREIPTYLLSMTTGEIIGMIAYAQVFALFESIVVTLFLIILNIVLPSRIFNEKFVSQGSLIVFFTSIWMLFFHYQVRIIKGLSPSLFVYLALIWLWVMTYIGLLCASLILIRKNAQFEQRIIDLVERLTVLSATYVLIDIVSIFIVIGRNVS